MSVKIIQKHCKTCDRKVAAQRNNIGVVGGLLYFVIGWLTCGLVWLAGLIHLAATVLTDFRCPTCGKKCGGDPWDTIGLLLIALMCLMVLGLMVVAVFWVL